MGLKELVGPFLGRPEVDRLSGSGHANMKEIRVTFVKQVWRFAFAFDPEQAAIILCGGEKQGKNQKLFYKQLISKADQRFDSWLKEQKDEQRLEDATHRTPGRRSFAP
jgi:hypothetical protein